MGDPGDPGSKSLEESVILNFLRNKPDQKAEVLKYIESIENVTRQKTTGKNPLPCSAPVDNACPKSPGYFVISSNTKNHSLNPGTKPKNPTQGLKRNLSPGSPEDLVVPQQVRQHRQSITQDPSSKRLMVILGSSLPNEIKKDRQGLLAAVKSAAPTGIILGEIKLTRNDEILVSCRNEHDHNCCLRMDRWSQSPHTFIPRFNLSASNDDIIYIKSVPTEVSLMALEDHLKREKVSFSNLERVKTGKDRLESLTLRLLVHDKDQKEKLIRWGILIDHRKFRVEPHVKTSIKQCFKCLGFGHLIADCKGAQSCTRCGGQHVHKDCPVDRDSPTCANCAKDDSIPPEKRSHAASDRGCPIRIKMLRDARRQDLKSSNHANINPSGEKVLSKEFPPLRTMEGFNFAAAAGGIPRQTTSTSETTRPPQTSHETHGNFIFGEGTVDQKILDGDHTPIISTILVVVADALTDILSAAPGISRDKICNSLIRSVGKLRDESIDIAMVARCLVKEPSNGPTDAESLRQSLITGSPHPSTRTQSTDLIAALSNQVISNAFKKPMMPPKKIDGKDSPSVPKSKRAYTRKSNPQGLPAKQRKISESSFTDDQSTTETSLNSITSNFQNNPLTLQSTPTGQRLAASVMGLGESPMLGAASALSSPNSSLINDLSQGDSIYMSPISTMDYCAGSDQDSASKTETPSLVSMLNLLHSSQPQQSLNQSSTKGITPLSMLEASSPATIQPMMMSTAETISPPNTVKKQPDTRTQRKKKSKDSVQDG